MTAGLSSWRRLGWRVWALELGGNALLTLVCVAWLGIPDSHVWELLLSLLLAAGIGVAVLWMQVWVLRRLRGCVTLPRMWVSCGALLGWVLLWWGLAVAAGHLDDGAGARAVYWNSRLSPGWRARVGYERLGTWQMDVVAAIVWWVIPALVLPFLVEMVACGGRNGMWRRSARVLRSWWVWIATGAAAWLGFWASGKLVAGRPGQTVKGELVSVGARLTAIFVLDVALLVLLLAVVAELLRRVEDRVQRGGNAAV
jgi:hypothetical protein